MYNLVTTNRFKKDLKRSQKRGYDIKKLKQIMVLLAHNKTLPEFCKDHSLIGNYKNRRECHIAPDWLLIYKINHDENEIIFERTGTHSDLFKT